MNQKLLFLYVLLVFSCSCSMAFSQVNETRCQHAHRLIKMFEKFHYKPFAEDSKTAEQTFRLFLKELDPHGLYFTQKDIASFSIYKALVFEDIKAGKCSFLDLVTKRYKEKLLLTDSVIEGVLKGPVNFNVSDTLFFQRYDSKDPYYSETDKDLKKRWSKWLRYKLLDALMTPTDEKDQPYTKSNKELLLRESVLRKKIQLKERKKIALILNHPDGFENYVSGIYLNSLALRFDPHSSYFSLNEKNNFEQAISAEAPAFGFSCKENENGQVIIKHLVPGGPAWKSNELHQGDVLLRLKLSGEAIKDLSEADLEEVENILRGFNGKDAAITIMQANHQIKTVTLAKEKLRVDENVIKSYILQGEKRIGYIALPDFYRQTGAGTAMGCANDVAKEILKISKENIDGLLLDLRYNGGGDMQEALDLAGLFIDEGPLCVVSDGKSKPEVLKDSHRGKVYDGPLALLVNGMSASASELLACALQDYNRAVIVGATTYGKGSYQVVMPLDTLYNSALKSKEKSDPGYLKITLGKFYRVTGRSHQKKGVVPDVILPDMIDLYDLKEGNEKYALNSDSIQKKIYYHPMEALPVKELAHRSGLRLATDKNFKALTVIHDSIQKEMKLEHKVPIHIDAYKKFEKQADARRKVEERLEKDSTSAFTVLNNSYDAEIFKIDTYRKEINDAVLKNIKEDLYIDETLKIVKDLIEIHTKK